MARKWIYNLLAGKTFPSQGPNPSRRSWPWQRPRIRTVSPSWINLRSPPPFFKGTCFDPRHESSSMDPKEEGSCKKIILDEKSTLWSKFRKSRIWKRSVNYSKKPWLYRRGPEKASRGYFQKRKCYQQAMALSCVNLKNTTFPQGSESNDATTQ